MERRLLVTVSDDSSYLHGITFLESFIGNKAKVRITLFLVSSQAEAGKQEGRGFPKDRDMECLDAAPGSVRDLFERCRDRLSGNGFLPEKIGCKYIQRQMGTVKDIIREGRAGAYDAVVLGRRGYVLFESVMALSVSKEILAQNISFPVWVCRRPEKGRKNVLLCVDGSEAGLRIADHVGFMLQNEEDHSVTVFHVASGEVKNVDAVLAQAISRLKENNLAERRISTRVVDSSSVAKTILKEAEAKAYAVVAAGRVGLKKGMLREWIVGSRTKTLLENIEKAVLWVSG